MSDAEIRAHNAREAWLDVANHLQVAHDATEHAQGVLDADLGLPSAADALDEVLDMLRRGANDAREAATNDAG